MDRGTRREIDKTHNRRKSFTEQICAGCILRKWARARRLRKLLNKRKHRHGHSD
jgi:hypothetical protein